MTSTPTGVLQVDLSELLRVLVPELVQLLGLSVTAAVAAGLGALGYRWYVREPLPNGLAAILGVGTVAVYLNTVGLFGQVLDPTTGPSPFAPPTVVRNVVALAGGVVTTPVGRWVGDRLAVSLLGVGRTVDPGVGRLRGRLGGATAVELPATADIEDAAGYDPVPEATKERLGGRTVALARGPGAITERLRTHLRESYGVGHVDADVTGGTVSYLALGTRPAGVAPTLPPGTVAVPVRADPPNGAGPGDLVQVWTVDAPAPGDTPAEADATGATEASARGESASETTGRPVARRVTTGELRATAGETVTLALDESDTTALSADREYRLVTLPARPGADRAFASLLSATEQRMDAVGVAADGPLVGTTVDDVAGAVVAVRTTAGELEPIPPRARTLSAGETLYVVATPETLRRLGARGEAGDRPQGERLS